MGHVPAFCDNCGNIFPSGFVFEGALNVTMKGNKSQCPRCNYLARVPDGVFSFYKEGIQILEATEETIQDLKKFYKIIEVATKVESTPQEVQQEIETKVPKLSFLAKYLPQNAKELGVYLTAISTLIGGFGGNIEVNPHIEIGKTEITQNFDMRETHQHIAPALEVHSDSSFIMPDRKIGRNEPCPCESGKKFKYCHGQ